MDQTETAAKYIIDCCPKPGASQGWSDVRVFLSKAADEIATSKPTSVLPDRYAEHVAYAVNMIARSAFLEPPAAIASVYLATRFEFYFRILSGRLNGDGTWISKADKDEVKGELSDSRLSAKRISSVALAYKVMKLNQTLRISRVMKSLDSELFKAPMTVVGDIKVADIGDRVEFGRHAVGHGQWGDMSAEGIFYGLLTAVVFYSQQRT